MRAFAWKLATLLVVNQLTLVSSSYLCALAEPAAAPQGAAGAPQASGWDQPALREQPQQVKQQAVSQPAPVKEAPQSARAKKIRTDWRIAYRMAKDPWLFKIAAADPSILAAICEHSGAATRLVKNRHLGDLASCDHYLCRRLTRWSGATWALVRSPQAEKVIAFDPEGIYRAIDKNPAIAHALAKNIMFNEMVTENPDLGKFIALHM